MIIRTIMKYHSTTVRLTLTTPNAGEDTVQQNYQMWKTLWQFLTELKTPLAYNPAIMLLRIYPNALKAYVLYISVSFAVSYTGLLLPSF